MRSIAAFSSGSEVMRRRVAMIEAPDGVKIELLQRNNQP